MNSELAGGRPCAASYPKAQGRTVSGEGGASVDICLRGSFCPSITFSLLSVPALVLLLGEEH